MKDELMLQLLTTIKFNLSVDGLINMELTYADIGEKLAALTEKGYINRNVDLIKLSEKGEAKFNALKEKMDRNVKFLWIRPLLEESIPKIDKNEVYLPKNWRK